MYQFWRLTFITFLILPAADHAQSMLSPSRSGSNSEGTAEVKVTDPLGRTTPRGTVLGFIKAVQKKEYKLATQYLQLTGLKRKVQAEELAGQLEVLIDRTLQGYISQISDLPEGSVTDSETPTHESAGTFVLNGNELDFDLVRVGHERYGPIWLVSPATLNRVPDLYEQVGLPGIEHVLPAFLVEKHLFAMSLWQWIAWLLSIPLALTVSWLLFQIAYFARKLIEHLRSIQYSTPPQRRFSAPLMVILALLIHGVFFHRIGAPILYRYYYSRFLYVLLVLSFTWLLWIIIDRAFERMILRARSATGGAASAESLMIVGRRIARIVLMFIIVLIILPLIGVNPTTALAGVGIGGIVVALAAQKTMENLFGGVSLLMDRVIQVGDVCKIGDRVGTVEDIGLRSIRIRTVEQTELSVPNGALAQVQFENFKGRSKFNLSTTIGLRYETSADQLRVVLADIRRMLYEHPKVETGSARIRFARFGQSALELDLFAYILTSDMPEFMAIREDLHLRMMDIVLAAGTGFAFPSQTVYISQDTGLDSARSETALKRVREWREKQQIPFPDFSRELVADIENKIIYPPADSMVRKPQK